MQLKTILNRVQRHSGFVYAECRLVEGADGIGLEVRVRPDKRTRAICSICGEHRAGYDTLAERRFHFVPLWGMAVFFLYAMRRVACPQCGVVVEAVPWASGNHHLTKTYAWFLALWAKRMSWKEVAVAFRTSWENVFRSVEMAVEWGLANRDLSGITAIGVDEVLWHRGYKFLTVVYQIDQHCKRLLWIGKDRTTRTILSFFRAFGRERSAALRFVCSDMWKPYLKVIAKKASQAIHILDRFHIMAKMNKAIDEVRAKEMKALRGKGLEPVLKDSRWCLLKRPENLTERQEVKLADLVRYNLRTVRSYLLKEDFQFFWLYYSAFWAGRFLDRWCTRAMRSRIEPMQKIARMLRVHRPLILNWFRASDVVSTGAVEGLNNRLKVITRRAFGFRTFRATEIALYHTLGALPVPQVTHKFC